MSNISITDEGKKMARGFTLIELLIYLAIVGTVVNSLVLFALNVMRQGTKSTNQQAINASAIFLSEKIKYEIRNASDINFGSSDFGINLSTNEGKKISLEEDGANNPTIFDIADSNVRITRGALTPVLLNPDNIKISDLTFTNLSSGNGSTKHLEFTLTLNSLIPSPGNIYESVSLKSSAELRSH